ncbi:hypothetical protein REPUB_Repub10bG0020300 [Reevesia pubescens]
MGLSSSKEDNWRERENDVSGWDSNHEYPQSSYSQESQSYAPQRSYASPHYYPPSQKEPQYYQPSQKEPRYYQSSQDRGSDKRMLDRKYSRIADNYNSFDQVIEALANAGFKTCNLIVGIDFTKSNTWTGRRSFNGKSLHHIGDGLNPYEQAISIIEKKLAASNEDNLIPCYGFGDASTCDHNVFSFNPDDRFCNGFEEVLSRNREIVPQLRLSGFHYAPVSHPCFELPFEAYPINIYYFLPGPTTFAPVIEMAMTIVEQSVGQYHVLVIIADGQATRSPDTQRGQLSSQEQNTVDAIAQASKLPLSIILIGVGDGPWDMMKEFDDNIPSRAFDNFQFVNFTEIMSKNIASSQKETEFALAVLMKIPSQYKATIELNILGGQKGKVPKRVPLPPPTYDAASHSSDKRTVDRRFLKIADNYNSFDQVMEALANAGLKTCNLIVGIDFTKSNTWTGTRSFNGKILHHIGGGLNPYEQAISIIGKKLAASIEHNLIPCYGFGDASTRDQNVFSFSPDDRFCNGFEEVLSRYREIVPQLLLSGFHYAPVSHPCFELPFEAYPINIYYFLPGPTTFAPVIEMAMTIVEQSVGQYHVLVIIADGQVFSSVYVGSLHLGLDWLESKNEQKGNLCED